MEVSSVYPGSVGEILQGNYKDIDILCSCPINLYTRVKVFESKNILYRENNLKSRHFIGNILRSWGYESYVDTVDLEIRSDIPRGKGFASSTADLCAVYGALIKLFNKEYNEDELVEHCIKIEPSDSILFNKLTLFDYKNGVFKEEISQYPKMSILVFEGSKRINTIEFNQRQLPPLNPIDDLVETLKNSSPTDFVKTIGAISTESITRNQNRLKYDILEEILEVKDKTGGAGIIGAHSGDVLGIIYGDYERAQVALHNNIEVNGYKSFLVETIGHSLDSN